MRVLFIHGAGGFIEDQVIADGLRTFLRATVDMPQLSDEDRSVETWAATVRQGLAGLGADDVVLGHSFGATILQWVLPERTWRPRRALLLALNAARLPAARVREHPSGGHEFDGRLETIAEEILRPTAA